MFSLLAGLALVILASCIGAFFIATGVAMIRYMRLVAEKQQTDADVAREAIDWLNDVKDRVL